MPATLSDKGQAILADLPGYYADDPHSRAVIDSVARELARLEAAAAALADGMLPTAAQDANRTLGIWEKIVDLPIEPAGVSTADRIAKAVAHFRKRRAAKGNDWIALLTQAIGSENWSHFESQPYTVTILIPQAQGSYTAETVKAIAQKITPANLKLNVQYDQGFLVGYSPIGQRQI